MTLRYVPRGSILDDMDPLIRTLKRLRRARGLTQQRLAVKAGVSLGYLQRLEVGTHDPRLSTLKKLARGLGVPLARLLT
jgi:predicted transcriptional regulator